MIRKALFLVGAPWLLLFPAPVMAGGPPWLCLPIDGVTRDKAQECVALVSAKLDGKLWPHAGPYRDVRVDRRRDQWYLTFGIGEDVRLGDVEAALKGSGFAIPRDKLRLFGHVILEIDVRTTPRTTLLADLEALDHVSIATSQDKEDLLLVTVEMPYPATDDRPERESVGWDAFRWNDYSAKPSTTSEPTATSAMLPSYVTFHDLAAKHKASLKDLRWSTSFACRALGGVVPATTGKLSKLSKPSSPIDR